MNTTTSPVEGEAVDPAVLAALFEYEAAPGRFPLVLREPRVLFENPRELLLMSAGRRLNGLSGVEAEQAKRAAIFFVRTAMFRANADHYTLLGLQPDCNDKEISDHYRLLMRLIHPDFATAKDAWPRDAAVRANLANDVLSSPEQRAQYDDALLNTFRRNYEANNPIGLASSEQRPAWRSKAQLGFWVAGLATAVVILLFQLPLLNTQPSDSSFSLVVPSKFRTDFKTDLKTDTQSSLVTEVQTGMKFETLLQLPPAEPAPVGPIKTKLPAEQNDSSAKPANNVALLKNEPLTREASFKIASAQRPVPRPLERVRPDSLPAPRLETATALQILPNLLAAQSGPVAAVTVAVEQSVALPRTTSAPAVSDQAGAIDKSGVPASTAPSLADAQLPMNQFLQALQSGVAGEILKGLDRPVRQSSGAADVVQAYTHLIGNSRLITLGPVKLRSRPQADRLVIDGVVPLILQDQGKPEPIRELRLRAQFARRGDSVVMTELSTAEGRP